MGAFPKKTIADVPLDGQRVLLRVDYNVGLANGRVADDYRIAQSLPTLRMLCRRGCQVVVCSHLGRPLNGPNPAFTLAPVATRLGELLSAEVAFVPECIGDKVVQAVKRLGDGQVLMLENLRFHPGEVANDAGFAHRLAVDSGAAYFVQDGFGVAHRAHASTDAITRYLPSVAGLLLQQEYTAIVMAMEAPKRPMVVVLGGDKVVGKTRVIERFIDVADRIIIGGAMANTFLHYKGYNVGKSVYERGQEENLQQIYARAIEKVSGRSSVDEFIVLPTDVVVTTDVSSADPRSLVVCVGDVSSDELIADIGTQTVSRAVDMIRGAGTVVWSGTVGITEKAAFSEGSAFIADAIAKQPEAIKIVGGGDTAGFVLRGNTGRSDDFTHISTGGGACLVLMAGEKLPGLEALMGGY
jgi:phosphoglycerate kinase